jgi:hypothetical protein
MARYSEDDQPQLQWAEDMIDMLLRMFVAIWVTFWRSMAAALSSITKKDD